MVKYQSPTTSKEVYMGKKSLTKSTTKKKSTSKKKSSPKKKTVKAAAKKTTEKGKNTIKTASKKATTSKKKATSVKTKTKKAAVKKPKTKRRPSLKTLLKKDFGSWKPDKQFQPKKDKAYAAGFSATSFTEGLKPEDAARIKALLARQIDLTVSEIKDIPEHEKTEPTAKPIDDQQIDKEIIETGEEESIEVEEVQEVKEKVTTVESEKSIEEPPLPPMPEIIYKKQEPMSAGIKIFLLCLACIFLVLLMTSKSNTNKFFLEKSGKKIEISKGLFSPTKKEKLITLTDVELNYPKKPVYSKEEAYSIIYRHHIEKADTLSDVDDARDFEKIRSHLDIALSYALTPGEQQKANKRMTTTEFLSIIYKADVQARKNSENALQKALSLLNSANAIEIDKTQKELVNKKIITIKGKIAALKRQKTKAQKKKRRNRKPTAANKN